MSATPLQSARLESDCPLAIYSPNAIRIDKAIESSNVLFINSEKAIMLTHPASLTAPIITLIAKSAIELGAAGYGPVKIEAASRLHIDTDHLMIGLLELTGENPDGVFFSCRKITLLPPTSHDKEFIRFIRTHLLRQATILEFIP